MMKTEHEPKLTARMQLGVTELENLVRQRYPHANFQVRRSTENPRIVHLVTTVDVEDRDEVMDVVIDRMMELQIQDKLPLFVVPVRPRERTLAMLRERAASGHPAPTTPNP
jgi:hypothetical protein